MHEFSTAIRSNPILTQFQADIRNAELKIFGSWRNEISLLQSNPQLKQEQFTVYLKNQRILKRMAVKLGKEHFPKLQDALLLCSIAVEERMPKVETLDNSVPFPDSGVELLVDLKR